MTPRERRQGWGPVLSLATAELGAVGEAGHLMSCLLTSGSGQLPHSLAFSSSAQSSERHLGKCPMHPRPTHHITLQVLTALSAVRHSGKMSYGPRGSSRAASRCESTAISSNPQGRMVTSTPAELPQRLLHPPANKGDKLRKCSRGARQMNR